MAPWEIIERLSQDADTIKQLGNSDPFWLGASYAMDPFVGIIVRLPLRRDPKVYGDGVSPQIFEKIVDAILDGSLKGDSLVVAIEAFSKYCQEDEWLFWYKRILQGEMCIPLTLEQFNQHCPEAYRIAPPALSNPKPIKAREDLPDKFFLQPVYPMERVFWLIDSTHTPIEIRCYNEDCKRVHNQVVEEYLVEFARKQPMDIVLFGHQSRHFVADDILTREQFTQEIGAHPLHRRLMGLAKLELPVAQMSPLLTPHRVDKFYSELNLLLEQGFEGAILRDLDAHYPFRKQADVLIKPSTKYSATCTEITENELRGEAIKGKKTLKLNVRLGLTQRLWKDISESSIGRRFDVLACGQKEGELLLPRFIGWK